MKTFFCIFFLFVAAAGQAQTVATTANVLHPIMKDRNKPYAPSSLDRDPSMRAEYTSRTPGARAGTAANASSAAAGKPLEIVAKVDSTLEASPISLIGTVEGLKGKMEVKNVGGQVVVPTAQFAVCDRKGYKIGVAAKSGTPLGPNESERLEIFATNADAADLKLVRLFSGSGK